MGVISPVRTSMVASATTDPVPRKVCRKAASTMRQPSMSSEKPNP